MALRFNNIIIEILNYIGCSGVIMAAGYVYLDQSGFVASLKTTYKAAEFFRGWH